MLHKWQEDNLRVYRVELVETIDVISTTLFSKLESLNVLNRRQTAQIRIPLNDQFRQVELLLDHMHRRPPEDYEKFMKGLNETNQGAIVRRYLARDATGDTPEEETANSGGYEEAVGFTASQPEDAAAAARASTSSRRVYVDAKPASLPPNAQGVRLSGENREDIQHQYIHFQPDARLTERMEKLHIVDDGVYEEIPAYQMDPDEPVQESEETETNVKELAMHVSDGIRVPIEVPRTSKKMFKKLAKDTDLYQMDKRCKGRCCIISVHKVSGRGARNGTDEDMKSLEDLFNQLGYLVEAYSDTRGDDVSSQGILRIMGAFSGRFEPEDSSAVVCLLSHGENGSIRGTDDKPVLIKQVLSYLDNKNCPNLRNKPKMLFTQACRGDKRDDGVYFPDGAQADAVTSSSHAGKRVSIHPTISDFLIGYATQDDHRAWRLQNGSIYIRSLVVIFMNFAHVNQVPDMLVKVNDLVSKVEIQTGDDKFVCQMPSFENQLRKRLFFFPGIGS